MTTQRSPEELHRLGFKALVEALGLPDAIRFVQQLSPGQGDYTAERHQWLPNDLDEVLDSLARKAANSRPTVGASTIGPFEIAAREVPLAD